jgi:hypothetical protein
MAEAATHTGSCHCGAVRFEATLSLDKAMACNCSMCQRKGSLLSFIPAAQFKLLTPDAPLKDYFFNKKKINHQFCPTCGMHPFASAAGRDGSPMVAVNLRCLEDVDLTKIEVTTFDGRKL